MARNRQRKTIYAGSLVYDVIYDRASRGDSDQARRAKRKASSEAQKRLNAKHSWEKLERMLAANFRAGDLWVTVTYDNGHLPRTKKEADQRFDYFLQKLKAARRKKKQSVVCFSNTEHKHRHDDFWQDRRWHHHFVINATGDDYELIRACWIYGDNIEIKPLRLNRDNTFEALARYMCKEAPDKVGQHPWRYTRGTAQKPEVDSRRADSAEQLHIPRGALVLMNEKHEGLFGSWFAVKYLLPGWDQAGRAPKARRRRR